MAEGRLRGSTLAITDTTERPSAEPGRGPEWHAFYGLSKAPFDGSGSYVLFGSHRRAFEAVADHMINRAGLLLLQADAGAGKTVMLRAARDAGIRAGIPADNITLLSGPAVSRDRVAEALGRAVAYGHTGHPRVIVLVDDADAMKAAGAGVLARLCEPGSPDLAVVATVTAEPAPDLVRLAANRLRLPVLTQAEMRDYIEQSLWVAGGTTRRLLAPDALRLVVAQAAGLPGAADRMMAGALNAGFVRGEPRISRRTLVAAIGPRRLPRPNPLRVLVPVAALALFVAGASAFLYEAFDHENPSAPVLMPSAAPAAPAMPAVPRAANTLAPDVMAALIRRGEQALTLGDIAAARLSFEHAAEAGNAAAAEAAGKTYDPNFLADGAGRPDPARAAIWYRRATALGDPKAPDLLRRLGAAP